MSRARAVPHAGPAHAMLGLRGVWAQEQLPQACMVASHEIETTSTVTWTLIIRAPSWVPVLARRRRPERLGVELIETTAACCCCELALDNVDVVEDAEEERLCAKRSEEIWVMLDDMMIGGVLRWFRLARDLERVSGSTVPAGWRERGTAKLRGYVERAKAGGSGVMTATVLAARIGF